MSRALVEQVRAIQEQFSEESRGVKHKPFSVLDLNQLGRQARQMGEGVKFVSASRISRTWGEGYKAIFSFKDVGQLKIMQDPNKIPTGLDQDEQLAKQEEAMRFRFTKGSPSTLMIILSPSDFKPGKPEAETHESDSTSDAMMLEMLKGLRFSSVVEVNGTIKETNATYKEGQRITLFDVEFEKLVADREKFKQLSRIHPNSLEEAKELLKDIPGLKVETNRVVTVKFQ